MGRRFEEEKKGEIERKKGEVEKEGEKWGGEEKGEGRVRRQHRRMDVPVFIFH